MKAEFDTVAAWTAEVALDLGPDHYLPAGCRGSGSPGALRWLLDRLELLAELRRVLRPEGRLGLLVFVATRPLPEQPVGNTFPTEEGLRSLLAETGLVVENSASATDFAGTPPLWQQRAAEVEAELERRHGDDPAWQVAGEQSAVIGRLLAAGELVGALVAARPG
jgi:hypothetical protein